MADKKVPTRYYELPPDTPGDAAYFRVSSGGRYDRWDADEDDWVHVTDGAARDYYSRAVEGGEAVPGSAPKRSAER